MQLPAGVRGAKPMPKPGWTLAERRAPLAQPVTSHGKTVTDDVAEVTWTASTAQHALPDAHYDEFVLRATLPAAAGPLWFPVRQVCEQGRIDWVQQPASGTAIDGLKWPAALLDVLPAEPASAHQH